jgi:hypothetical protein
LTHIAITHKEIKEYDHFPTNKVDLILNKPHINSHYAKMVNLAFHSMVLREYYAVKHNWLASDIASIWWPVYYQSLAKLPENDKLRIKKFVSNHWPTLHHEQKYYKCLTGSSYCKKSNLHSKTEYHIIRCLSSSRQKDNRMIINFIIFLFFNHNISMMFLISKVIHATRCMFQELIFSNILGENICSIIL